MNTGRIVRGSILTFRSAQEYQFEENGAIAVDSTGRIAWTGPWSKRPPSKSDVPIDDYGGCLLVPGFIDAHIHFPQYRILAAPGKNLLDWLHRFTFPEEARYADRGIAEACAPKFLDMLVANGTTSALVFSSSHKVCADALFAEAEHRNMGIITGKTMMDRNAIPAVQDSVEESVLESEALLKKWHGRGRARYAISPRFAITSTEAQLKAAGKLLQAHPGVIMQTHLSESRIEIETVKQLFPNDRDYVAVYDRFGLLGPTSLFAHGIHLAERECGRLFETASKVIHCPTSNSFLGSGLFNIAHLRSGARAIDVGMATDIGGGTSYSMLATMAESYKIAMLQGIKLSAPELFHRATAGNAQLLGLEMDIGTLETGKFADIAVLDPAATPVLAARHELSKSLEDVLFALALLGDDRAVRATYVAGNRVHYKEQQP